jgi:hypothetical protein
MEGVLICRGLQLYHPDPLPTIAGFHFARMYTDIRQEDGTFPLDEIITYAYTNLDQHVGAHLVASLKPDDMTDVAYLMYRLRVRCSTLPETFLDEVFSESDAVPDTEFLAAVREQIALWIEDEPILELLEDEITREEAEVFFDPAEEELVDEYALFNALAVSYNTKIRGDLSYLRGLLMAETEGSEQVPSEVVQKIFVNHREYAILFQGISDSTVTNILKRVLRYLEGDIIVKADKSK